MPGEIFTLTEEKLERVNNFEDDLPRWETVKTAAAGEKFTDFKIEVATVYYSLYTNLGKYTGLPKDDGSIDWKLERGRFGGERWKDER